MPGLEKSLTQYLQTSCDEPFDMSTVPLAAVPSEAEVNKAKAAGDPMFTTPGKFGRFLPKITIHKYFSTFMGHVV